MTDWNPDSYARFTGLRLRPAADLLAQVPGDLPPGPVVDLGCGAGAAGPLLRARYGSRRIEGLDSSAAMLDKARGTACYDSLADADIATWHPADPPALIFSNAVLHWLGPHDTLLPRLVQGLAPGGVLAVQMPGQHDAPSHRLARDTAWGLFPALGPAAPDRPAVATPDAYWHLLSPHGTVSAWETTYLQHLAPVPSGHPVRAFTESTVLRPILAPLDPDQQATFLAAYDAALDLAYPRLRDGSALFPFRRVFFVVRT
ncbi:MAG: methyltransferase domain-containing protein [Gemmobacter sp.]|nr:methyltransferase domain-containing protein [Gemmobacter sp.]